jgi:hypothetical protein
VTLLPGLAAAFLVVWALGGELGRIVTLRFRRTALLYAALAGQLVAFGPVRFLGERQIEQAQLATYALLLAFCVANRRVPGMWLVACGIVANTLVIAVNGGVMPVDPGAIAASGWTIEAYASAYPNVLAHQGAPLWWLGDIFAMPRFHGSAVLSVGDVSIIAGAWLLLQRAAAPPLAVRRFGVGLNHRLLIAGASLLAALALVGARHAFVDIASGFLGASLAPTVLATCGRRPPAMRCVSVSALLGAGALALSESIGSNPTSALAAATAGLLVGISGLTIARLAHERLSLDPSG